MNTENRLSPSALFRIKICGLTRVEDVEMVCRSGADAIGLNFYPASSRFVGAEQAKRLRDCAGERVKVVGVWVNEPPESILETASQLQLDMIQLHGDEPIEALEALDGSQILKAIRHPFEVGTLELLRQAKQRDLRLAGVLIDAAVPGLYGGTGNALNWAAVRDDQDTISGLPFALAGGLTPANVAEAIASVRPTGVDVASGVENGPGIKDAQQVAEFVSAAEHTFTSLG